MKVYPIVDLTSDKYLNPDGYIWNDGEGSHERSLGQITSISVHHDAAFRPHDYDSVGRYHTEAAEHYQRLGFGLQYHAKIDNQGTIFLVRPFTTWLNVVGSAANVTTLAVCLDGNFETGQQQPTQEQYEALKQLLDNWCTQHPEFPAAQADVYPHRHFSPTDCCGDNLVGFVDNYRFLHGNVDIPQVGYDWPSMQPNATPPTPPSDGTSVLPVAVHPAPAPAQYWRLKDQSGKQLAAYSNEPNAVAGWHERGDSQDVRIISPDGTDVTPAPAPPSAGGQGSVSSPLPTPTPVPASVPAPEPMVVGSSETPAAQAAGSLQITPKSGTATLGQAAKIYDLLTLDPVGVVAANPLNPKVLTIKGSVAVDGVYYLMTQNMVEAAAAGVYHGIRVGDFLPKQDVVAAQMESGFVNAIKKLLSRLWPPKH